MRKNLPKPGLFLAILCICIWACQKDKKADSTITTNQFSPEEAKTWLATSSSHNGSVQTLTKSPITQQKEVDWEKSIAFKSGDDDVLEFPIITNSKNVLGLEKKTEKKTVESPKEIISLNRVVFRKRKNGEIDAAIMTVVPDNEMPQSEKKRIAESHYKKVDPSFSGVVLFHTWKGDFLTGWRYEKGIIKKKLSLSSKSRSEKAKTLSVRSGRDSIQNFDAPLPCETILITEYCADCTDWYVNGSYYYTSCGGAYICGQYYYQACDDSGGGGGGGYGGGGGGSGGNGSAVISDITNNLLNPCLTNTYTAATIKIQNGVTTILNSTFGVDDALNLAIQESTSMSNSVDGDHSGSRSGGIFNGTVTLNANILPNASKEYIVATLYHEILHCYLTANLLAKSELAQHEYMVQSYINTMKLSLMTLFSNLDPDTAEALCWGGLQDTAAWNTILTTDPTRAASIITKNQQHRYHNTTGAGTGC